MDLDILWYWPGGPFGGGLPVGFLAGALLDAGVAKALPVAFVGFLAGGFDAPTTVFLGGIFYVKLTERNWDLQTWLALLKTISNVVNSLK